MNSKTDMFHRNKLRHHRFVSVSTSFSASSGDLDTGYKKMHSYSNLLNNNHMKTKSHTLIKKPGTDDDGEEFIMTTTIKEVDSEDDEDLEELDAQPDSPNCNRNRSANAKERGYSGL